MRVEPTTYGTNIITLVCMDLSVAHLQSLSWHKGCCEGAGKGKGWLQSLQRKLGLTEPRVAQRYYPQCINCCQKQSAAVKANRRTLVVHKGGPRPWHYAGIPLAVCIAVTQLLCYVLCLQLLFL